MIYRILYEEVDESQVDILKIISPASEGASIDEYRYPKAGTWSMFVTKVSERVGTVCDISKFEDEYRM